MTKVTFFYENGAIVKVRAEGHSGCGESGSDIVCAAVSTLVQTAYLALKDIGASAEFTRDESNAVFEFTVDCSAELRHDADVILRAVAVGLTDLQSGFPQYINIGGLK